MDLASSQSWPRPVTREMTAAGQKSRSATASSGKRMSQAVKSAAVAAVTIALGGLAVTAVQARQGASASQQRPPFIIAPGPAQCRSSGPCFPGKTFRHLAAASAPATFSPAAAASARSLRLQGDAAALRLDLHQVPTTDVLAALHTAFHVEYHATVALNEPLTGTYAGSLAQVVARVLDGYDYVIRQDSSSLDASIFGKAGARAVADPGMIPLRQR